MNNDKFGTLINKDKYQVFIFICPGAIPFNFAVHLWFVVNKKGEISRWEVLHRENQNITSWGHLHKNFLSLFSGIEIFTFSKKYFWKAKLLGYVEGDEDSTAAKAATFLDNSDKLYPYCHKYSLTGPNSNTYVAWVLDKFTDFKIKLPFNAIGKNYKIK